MFTVVFTGLVLATAGFCLTLAGWFAPPINDSVRGVRLAGPILLVVGMLVLALSCLICAINQERCCYEVVTYCRERRKRAQQRHLEKATARLRVTPNATLLDESRVPSCDDVINATAPAASGDRFAQAAASGVVAAAPNDTSGTHGCPVFANRNARFDQSPFANRVQRSRAPPTTGDLDPEITSDADDPSMTVLHQRTMYEGVGVRVKQFRKLSPNNGGDQSEAIHLLQEVTSSPTLSPYASPRNSGSARHNTSDRGKSHAQSASRTDAITAQSPKLCSHVTPDDREAGMSPMWDPGPVWTPRVATPRCKPELNTRDTCYIQHSNV